MLLLLLLFLLLLSIAASLYDVMFLTLFTGDNLAILSLFGMRAIAKPTNFIIIVVALQRAKYL
jgi:hypothetical protein